MEALVGAEGIALAGEHARRVLVLPLEGEDAGGEREFARQVLAHAPAQQLAMVLELGQGDLRHLGSRKRGRSQRSADVLAAYLRYMLVARIRLSRFGPRVEQPLRFGVQSGFLLCKQ